MLKENWRFISRIERIADAILIVACFFMAYYGRGAVVYWDRAFQIALPLQGPKLAPIQEYMVVLGIGLFSFLTFLQAMGAYGSMRMRSHAQLLKISVVSSFLVFFTLAAALFLLKIDLSRVFIGLFCVLVALSITLERYIVLRILRYWRRRGMNFRNIIICGMGDQALRLAMQINKQPELGLFVRAFADIGDDSPERVRNFRSTLQQRGYTNVVRIILGTDTLTRALREYAVDEVIFTDIVEVLPKVEELVMVASEQGIRTTLAADLFSMGLIQSGLSYFGDMPLIHFQTPPGDRWELSVKRLFDIGISLLLLILLSPLFLLIAVAVRLSSPGPIIFQQRRMGLNGRIFELYKFRSMYADAEGMLAELKPKNEMVGPVFKMRDDPRITPVGKFLRRFSLDELPQLWNVFVGDMSLVGPRPPIPGEVSLYERRDRRRLSMRPGLTCIWQVSGRSEITNFDSWVKMDLEYIDNWSLARDFVLLLRTVPAVLFGSGAR